LRAERSLRRAAKNVPAQNRAMKLPVIVWQDGKVVEKPAHGSQVEGVCGKRRGGLHEGVI
jgi:hypothetical protein